MKRTFLSMLFCSLLFLTACDSLSNDKVNTDISSDISTMKRTSADFSENTTVLTTISCETTLDSDQNSGTTVETLLTEPLITIVTDVITEETSTETSTETSIISSITELTPESEEKNTTATMFSETTTTFSPEYLPLEPLSEKTVLQLCNDYVAYISSVKVIWSSFSAEDMIIDKYLGTYNNCEVVVMYPEPAVLSEYGKTVTVGEYDFSIMGGLDILIHQDSTFIEITEAYSKGLLSDEDVAAIYYYFTK